jgi:5-(carboxyamino)imidazole ribonucleotide synthase
VTAPKKIGVLGGGQLGRMLALAGYPLNLHLRFLDPSPVAPAGDMAELMVAEFDDLDAVARFAEGLDVATYEFENVPADAARVLAERTRLAPGVAALETSQDRVREKECFISLDIPTPAFHAVGSQHDLERAVAVLGLPAVLKTRRLGYDGKGQRVLRSPDDVAGAYEALGSVPLILERFVNFDRELSIIGVRGRDGEQAYYPLVQNRHGDGILRLSRAPVDIDDTMQQRAESFMQRLLDELDYTGVLALEMFDRGGELIANEIAPRVHNSGHWTIKGAETSQFENHLRAVVGMPLGSTAAVGHSAMVNLIGTVPPIEAMLAIEGAHVHLYGKSERPGRKLGHVTLHAATRELLDARLPALLRVVDAR